MPGILLCFSWLVGGTEALASDPSPPAAPAELEWAGLVLPLAAANSIDGFGVGIGGEVYARPVGETSGYAVKITGLLWLTTNLNYTSDWVRVDARGALADVFGQAGFRGWANLLYAGVGGADVLVDWEEQELGNGLSSPFANGGVAWNLGRGAQVYGGVYVRPAASRPAPDLLLAQDDPLGADGALYNDVTVGLAWERLDRWPAPHKGAKAEIDARGGGTFAGGRFAPLAGLHAEVMGWTPLILDPLVVGGRLVAEHSVGERPFFEQDITGGRWRDELGSEQALAGYGRNRSRGDGVVAGMVEVRPQLFRVGGGDRGFDLAVMLSGMAEVGWLFDRWDPGPILPTVGGGPELLWQQAIQVRPFIAFGWRADAPGGPRAPIPQYGISFVDPL